MKQAEYKGQVYEIETVYVYDEYISIYKGNLLEGEAIKVPLSEVKILPMHSVIECLQQVNTTLERHGKVEANTDLHNKIRNTL